MRERPERHALLVGLAMSALAHLLLAVVNPPMEASEPTPSRGQQVVAPGRPPMVALQLRIADEAGSPRSRTTPPVVAAAPEVARARAADSLGASTAPSAAASPRSPARAVDRLLAVRDPLLWATPRPRVETREEQALREVAERLEKARNEPGFTPAEPPPLAPRGGGFGIRIPFGRKPPPPAQVVPAPARLASLPADSSRLNGDLLRIYYGSFTLVLPAVVRSGVPFRLSALLPGSRGAATVRVFVDRSLHGSFSAAAGIASTTLTIESAGSHRILVHILEGDGYPPSELVHVVDAGG